ncbi:DeoR family glycerol-3-phosphate regulon repressor [Paramixta manurensis]|uniref:DeoR family glycerol-3-phosphate regulon repressor n=1 Tax=Paramixta manurensis TaxID=2740817 RepID=A0A6M8UC77_9GAMM|nr:DeoR family glycerol-3-phosphate regulon repressor [Erwiniaceae bacterium PD-1]
MHKAARQRYLLDSLSEKGQMSVAELAAKLRVSADTVRRDLVELERQGLAQKNHGGAIALDLPAMNRQGRNSLLPQTKRGLGEAVAAEIPAGSTLILDAGSTVLAVAAALRGPATVITASLDVAQCLSERSDIHLILLGGSWDARQRLFAGSATLAMLARYRADIVVLGACAIHAQLGLSASQEADGEVKRAMLAASAQHWLVADHLKLNHCEPHLVAELSAIDRLFIDRPWDELGEHSTVDVNVTAFPNAGERYD